MQKDAAILAKAKRNSGAIYLMGYALEFSLKRKLSQTLGFNSGFPETNTEFQMYSSQIALFRTIQTGITPQNIHAIRNHDLSELLSYSGAESRIVTSFYNEWLIVKSWNPESRYKLKKYTLEKVRTFINAAKVILAEIN